MKTLKIGKSDLDNNNQYKGKENLSDWSNPFDGHVEIEEGLGYVVFEKSIVISGSLVAKAGSGIKAGEGIEAGWGIKAGSGIEAGEGIEAGWGIKAGSGIEAGLSIVCKFVLSFKFRLFAGTATFRNMDNEDKVVQCGKLEGGTVCYGEVKEVGMPDEKPAETLKGKEVSVEIDGKKYKAIIH